MTSLDDFPEHRREELLWHYATRYDWYDLDHIVAVSAGIPCRLAAYGDHLAKLRTPGFLSPDTPMGRVRLRLAELYGDTCFVCHANPATALDHDHASGYVRGLLCQACNTESAECVHLKGCPFADYLNDPPALGLRIRYPKLDVTAARARRRAAALGLPAYWPHG